MILAAIGDDGVADSLLIGKDIAVGAGLALVKGDFIFRAVGYVSICSKNACVVVKVIATVAGSAVRAVAGAVIRSAVNDNCDRSASRRGLEEVALLALNACRIVEVVLAEPDNGDRVLLASVVLQVVSSVAFNTNVSGR